MLVKGATGLNLDGIKINKFSLDKNVFEEFVRNKIS